MALPTISINNSTGSNTAASGAGPSTALTGTVAAVTNASGSATIGDAVDLSGVAVDGSAVLYVVTSSGRKFSKITAISGSSGAWTLTLEDTAWTTGTGLSWAIGGKRKDFETTNSNTKLLGSDAKPGWIIDIEEAGSNYVLTSTWPITASGTTSGPILIYSSSATRPTITSATASVHLVTLTGVSFITFRSLTLTHTGSTRGSGFRLVSSGGNQVWRSCLIDGCLNGIDAVNGITPVIIRNTTIKNGTGRGLNLSNVSGASQVVGCLIYNNALAGVELFSGGSGSTIAITRSAIVKNGGKGIYSNIGTSLAGVISLNDSTVAGNLGDGIYFSATTQPDLLTGQNNLIYGNGGYGVVTQSNTSCQNNYNNSLFGGNFFGGNTSGNQSTILAGVGDASLSVDPFTSSASGDFTLNSTTGGGAAVKGAGFPGTYPGASQSGYLDGGALQSQASVGGVSRARVVNA